MLFIYTHPPPSLGMFSLRENREALSKVERYAPLPLFQVASFYEKPGTALGLNSASASFLYPQRLLRASIFP